MPTITAAQTAVYAWAVRHYGEAEVRQTWLSYSGYYLAEYKKAHR